MPNSLISRDANRGVAGMPSSFQMFDVFMIAQMASTNFLILIFLLFMFKFLVCQLHNSLNCSVVGFVFSSFFLEYIKNSMLPWPADGGSQPTPLPQSHVSLQKQRPFQERLNES